MLHLVEIIPIYKRQVPLTLLQTSTGLLVLSRITQLTLISHIIPDDTWTNQKEALLSVLPIQILLYMIEATALR